MRKEHQTSSSSEVLLNLTIYEFLLKTTKTNATDFRIFGMRREAGEYIYETTILGILGIEAWVTSPKTVFFVFISDLHFPNHLKQ